MIVKPIVKYHAHYAKLIYSYNSGKLVPVRKEARSGDRNAGRRKEPHRSRYLRDGEPGGRNYGNRQR